MKIRIAEKEAKFSHSVTVDEALKKLLPADQKVLGALCGGQALELNETLQRDCVLTPLTYQDEEGRRIYERSLRFVLLLALNRLMPGWKLRIEHSISYGIYMRLMEGEITAEETQALEAEMRKIVRENLPFQKEVWSRREAMDYFSASGDQDKVRLLSYRPYETFTVYRCGGMAEYFYGAMLPSTGYVPDFELIHHAPGMVLQMPVPEGAVFLPFARQEKHLRVFAQSNAWCDILGVQNAADLNDLTVSGKMPDFIRVNEALHDKSLAEIAGGIAGQGAKAVFVAGPSSSGKTTFSNRLCIHLRVLGLRPVLISLDDFYLNMSELPPEADGKPDLEAITALDIPYLRECLKKLLRGEEAMMPRFDFETHSREKERYPLRLEKDQMLVMEGIHGLNPELHGGFDPALIAKVYISELTCLNLDHHNRIRTTDARLLRRIVRDHQFRNTPPEETLALWSNVRKGEEKWIFPYQEEADFMFNSALHYELPVLKKYAYELLKKIPPEDPGYVASRRLLKMLNYLLPATEEAMREIPPLSLLREFIGGCTLY